MLFDRKMSSAFYLCILNSVTELTHRDNVDKYNIKCITTFLFQVYNGLGCECVCMFLCLSVCVSLCLCLNVCVKTSP